MYNSSMTKKEKRERCKKLIALLEESERPIPHNIKTIDDLRWPVVWIDEEDLKILYPPKTKEG